MCYEDKVGSVADAIASLVQFDCVEEAEKYRKSYLLPEAASLALQIRETAEHVITNAARYGVAHLLDGEKVAYRTLISTVEEAIRLCATRFIAQHPVQPVTLPRDISLEKIPALA